MSNLGERMAVVARDLRSGAVSEDVLERVVDTAVRLVDGCDAAGITLARRHGKVETSESTDEVTVRADTLQEELREGPMLDAVWDELVVHAPQLVTDPRWPKWAPRAAQELGIGSSLSVQLFTNEQQVGALNLFSREADGFSDDDIEEAVAIGAHAAVAMLGATDSSGMRSALRSRTITSQATGIVMERFGLTDVLAFDVLRRLSSEQNRKIVVLAQEIVDDSIQQALASRTSP